MDIMTTKDAAKKWGLSMRRVQALCDRGQIPSAVKKGDVWLMPEGTKKPLDGRTKAAKQGGNDNARKTNKIKKTHN
jgi:hypothetical protein